MYGRESLPYSDRAINMIYVSIFKAAAKPPVKMLRDCNCGEYLDLLVHADTKLRASKYG